MAEAESKSVEYTDSAEVLFLKKVARGMPKTVLHLHMEGTLEADMAFELAKKYKALPLSIPTSKKDESGQTINIEVNTLDELRKVYDFEDLVSFLGVYSTLSSACLRDKSDFQALAEAYCRRAMKDNVVHCELFFDPQTHTSRGIPFESVVDGLNEGFTEYRKKGNTVKLIACFLRDHKVGTSADMEEGKTTTMWASEISADSASSSSSSSSAMKTCTDPSAFFSLGQIVAYNEAINSGSKKSPSEWLISGVGLDNAEVGFPPDLFEELYSCAIAKDLVPFAHAGEEGDPSYVWGAINKLKVLRIDHGVRSIEDPKLLSYLATPRRSEVTRKVYGESVFTRIPLTCCPRSNFKLAVFSDPRRNNLLRLLDSGVCVTVNSDDPSYFGGYATAQFDHLIDCFNGRFTEVSLPSEEKPKEYYRRMTLADLKQICMNGIEATMLSMEDRAKLMQKANDYFNDRSSDVGVEFYETMSGRTYPEA